MNLFNTYIKIYLIKLSHIYSCFTKYFYKNSLYHIKHIQNEYILFMVEIDSAKFNSRCSHTFTNVHVQGLALLKN